MTTGLGYIKVIYETDPKELMEEEVWPVLKAVHQDITALLSNPQDFKLVFYPRGGNKVAEVTRESISFLNYDPRLYSLVPNWVQSVVEHDKHVVS